MSQTKSYSNKLKAHLAGIQAEATAEQYLCSFGLKPITRNYRTKTGEIDLVMADGDYTVFIEVKYRNQNSHSHPFESITPRKQHRLVLAAQQFCLSRFRSTCVNMRFDGVALLNTPEHHTDLEWLKNIIVL